MMKNKFKFIALASLFISGIVFGSLPKTNIFVGAETEEVGEECEHSPISAHPTKATRKANYTGISPYWNNVTTSIPGYRALILVFGTHGVDYLSDSHQADTTNRATINYDIGQKLSINGTPIYQIAEQYTSTHVGYDHGYCYFFVTYPEAILTNNTTLHIAEDAEFMDVLLPEVNLKLVNNLWGRSVEYKEIAPGWNNRNSGSLGYNHLIITFGQHGKVYLADNKTADPTNRATEAYDIGKKLTFNGVPIYKIASKYSLTHVGYDHGYSYFFITYSTDLLKMSPNNMVPTIHIEANTIFMDVFLPEITLKFTGGGWVLTNASEFSADEPLDLDSYSLVEYPHKITNSPHAVWSKLPSSGCQLAFTLNSGNMSTYTGGNPFAIDNLYKTCINIYPNSQTIQLCDIQDDGQRPSLQTFTGFVFADNVDYRFEIEVVHGVNSTYKISINHCVVIDYTFSRNKSSLPDVWMVDYSNQFTLDYFKEVEAYEPTIDYGGSLTYDFVEGDPIYNFAGVVNAFNVYDDDVSYADLRFDYEEGAISDDKYNEGIWTLTISLSCEGYQTAHKEITINVHGKNSVARIYYDDSEPILVPVGSKLIPPTDPETYREGEYDYVFEGWYFEGGKWDFENDIVQGDMHLEAHYVPTPRHYTVTVNFEGIAKEPLNYSLTKGKSLPFTLFEMEGATFKVYLEETPITSLIVEEDVTITVVYQVVYTYVEAKEATCTEDGNIAYYYSPVYGNYYFADGQGRELIDNPFISKFGHDIVHLDFKDSTCSEIGNYDCYYCSNCHKHFVDQKATTEMKDWAIEKKTHDISHHDAVKESCTDEGNIEYWTCANEPGVFYGDKDCKNKIDNVIISAKGHDYRAAKYQWHQTIDGSYECKATITCSHCGDEISETKSATRVIIRAATCVSKGEASYSVRFSDERFNAQTKIVTIEKIDHTYVHHSEVKASEKADGVKEHFECSYCHSYFVKNGETYTQVNYSDLVIKYVESSKGCGGNITSTSILIFIAAGALAVLVSLKRKEER